MEKIKRNWFLAAMALVLAFVLAVIPVSDAAAAGSRTTDVVASGDSVGWYDISEGTREEFAYMEETYKSMLDLIMEINGDIKDLSEIAEIQPDIKDELEGKKLATHIFDLEPINGGIRLDDGRYIVTMATPQLTKNLKNVRLLHFSTERNLWEIIVPEKVDYDRKEITAVFDDLSPVAIIADIVPNGEKTPESGKSPQTGLVSTWPVFMGAAAVLLTAALVIAAAEKRRKKA